MLAALGALLCFSSGCGSGGGGGGGGGGGAATVTGNVLTVESNTPPSGGSVSINGRSSPISTTDGSFTITGLPVGAVTVTVTATGENTRTFSTKLVAGQNSLGNVFVNAAATGAYNATVTGTVVTVAGGSPVAGATVVIAGESTTSASDGTFTLTGLPVGLVGDVNVPVGTVSATGYTAQPITLEFALAAGNNSIGQIPLGAPVGTTPGAPFDISGKVTTGGAPAVGLTVTIAVVSGPAFNAPTATTDANGAYQFWVPVGTWQVTAVNASGQPKSVTVTVASQNTPVTAPTIAF